MSEPRPSGGGSGPAPDAETPATGRSPPAPILVLGCGNEAAGIDGFGPLAARRLQARLAALPGRDRARVEVHEAGARTDLLDLSADRWAILVLDAALAPGAPPGVLFDLDWREPGARHLRHGGALSSHGFGIAEQLALADALGALPPRVRLLGVTVAPQGAGAAGAAGAPPADLDPQCAAVARLAMAHVARWLAAEQEAGDA